MDVTSMGTREIYEGLRAVDEDFSDRVDIGISW